MFQGIDDALLKEPGNPADEVVAQVLADDVAAERERKPRLVVPPLAEIDDPVQAARRRNRAAPRG